MRANATDPVQLVAKRSSELHQLSAVLKCRASSRLLTPNILTATSRERIMLYVPMSKARLEERGSCPHWPA